MNEKELIDSVKRGSTNDYRPLVERYQTGLIIHCENLVKDRGSAEDIAQESFIKAYEKITSFDPVKARFSTWLYKIATNKCLDYLRKRHLTLPIANADDITSEATTILYDDEIERVRNAVNALQPPEYAFVIKAYYWEGKSYRVIADELNITTSTAGTWIRRAKQQLKGVLT